MAHDFLDINKNQRCNGRTYFALKLLRLLTSLSPVTAANRWLIILFKAYEGFSVKSTITSCEASQMGQDSNATEQSAEPYGLCIYRGAIKRMKLYRKLYKVGNQLSIRCQNFLSTTSNCCIFYRVEALFYLPCLLEQSCQRDAPLLLRQFTCDIICV